MELSAVRSTRRTGMMSIDPDLCLPECFIAGASSALFLLFVPNISMEAAGQLISVILTIDDNRIKRLRRSEPRLLIRGSSRYELRSVLQGQRKAEASNEMPGPLPLQL